MSDSEERSHSTEEHQRDQEVFMDISGGGFSSTITNDFKAAFKRANTMSREILTLSTIFYIAAFLLIVNVGMKIYYFAMPFTHWAEYYSVTPLYPDAKVNQSLKFVSDVAVYRETDFYFNDILYCENIDKEFERYNSQRSQTLNALPRERHLTVWPYSPGVAYPAVCRLESNIHIALPFGFNKGLKVIGPTFNIVE